MKIRQVFLITALLLLPCSLGFAADRRGIDCGCQKTGDYSIPTAFEAPAMSDSSSFITGSMASPGSNYELIVETQPVVGGVVLALIVKASEDERARFDGTVSQANWGFSPNDHHFVIHLLDLNGKYHIRLFNMLSYSDNEINFFEGFINESALGFSPSGRYFAAAIETQTGGLYIKVVDIHYPDDNVFVDSQATSVSSAGWGFSPKNLNNKDAAFFYSKKSGQIISAFLVNLKTMTSYPVGVSSNMWWGFSPCGDLFATLDATANYAVLLYHTATGQRVGLGGYTGIASDLLPRCDQDFHYIADEVIIENTAYDDCNGGTSPDEEEPQWPGGAELTAKNICSTRINLLWPAATDNIALAGYHIYKDGELIAEPNPAETTQWIYDLSPLTEYHFKIKAGDEEANWSAPLSLTVSTIEDAPTWPDDCNLTASNIEETYLDLEWTSAEDDVAVTAYQIYNYIHYSNVLVDEVPASTHHYHVTGLEPWTEYTLSIKAGDSSDNWTKGPRTTVQTPDNHPPTWPASKSIWAEHLGTTEITLEWSEPEDNVGIDHCVIYGERDGEWVVIGTGYSSYTVSCLTPATEFHFKVEAKDFAGNESDDGPDAFISTDDGYADCSGIMDLVSVSSDGEQTIGAASDDGWDPHTSKDVSISENGRFVAFASTAINLVPDDNNTLERRSTLGWSWGYDIFVHDRLEKTTERVSVNSAGAEAELGSSNQMPTISPDGRFVVFDSAATNLDRNDTNTCRDVFIHDRLRKTTRLVSSSSSGEIGNNHSGGWSLSTAISADNRYLAFVSDASNFDPNDTNRDRDVYIKDLLTETCTRVSLSTDGQQGTQDCWGVDMSADGRFVVFAISSKLVPDDTNGKADVYLHDRQTGETTRVSVSSTSQQGDGDCCYNGRSPRISGNGRYIVFDSSSTNLVENDINEKRDIFIHDRLKAETRLVSLSNNGWQANKDCTRPDINYNGRFVVYQSSATTLTGFFLSQYISDVYLWDRVFNTVKKMSRCPCGNQGRDDSLSPTINKDGSVIAFHSYANNLLANFGDNNSDGDAFVTEYDLVGVADPEITLSCLPIPPRLDRRMLCILSVKNVGTDIAENINIIATIPGALTITNVNTDCNEFTITDNEITLTQTSIPDGNQVSAIFELIPQTVGTHSILATLTCDSFESDILNNTAQLDFDVTADLTSVEFDGSQGINLPDLSVFALDWMNTNAPFADIAPEGGDGIVDFKDLLAFAGYWLHNEW